MNGWTATVGDLGGVATSLPPSWSLVPFGTPRLTLTGRRIEAPSTAWQDEASRSTRPQSPRSDATQQTPTVAHNRAARSHDLRPVRTGLGIQKVPLRIRSVGLTTQAPDPIRPPAEKHAKAQRCLDRMSPSTNLVLGTTVAWVSTSRRYGA
jgi:hypothetical protein